MNNLKDAFLQVKTWFQNRRMKDKRQRMAMSWPHPGDPGFYTYLMSQAAVASGTLQYPFPPHLPLPYYSPVGLSGPSGASGSGFLAASLRPLDPFRTLSHPYPRPDLLCAFRSPRFYPTATCSTLHPVSGCSCLSCRLLNGSTAVSRVPGQTPTELGPSVGGGATNTASASARSSGFVPYASLFTGKPAPLILQGVRTETASLHR